MTLNLKGKYGLIIPEKEKTQLKEDVLNPKKSGNVFGDSSDSLSDEEDHNWIKKRMKKQSHGSIQQKQSLQVIKKALTDDPTVFGYDEHFDTMEKERSSSKETIKKDRKPKYISNLIKTAEKRKLEEEARKEREVEKEREKEGDLYKDKESFVTGAYRKKMEQLEILKQEQNRKDAIDDLVDVTKQKDLSGFYRHLYNQKYQEEEKPDSNTKSPSPTPSQNKVTESRNRKFNVNANRRKLSPSPVLQPQETNLQDHQSKTVKQLKSSIWEKRTVGTKFDDAVKRYLARKEGNTHQATIIYDQ